MARAMHRVEPSSHHLCRYPLGGELERTPFTNYVTSRIDKEVKWHRPHDFSNDIEMSNYETCLVFGMFLHNYKSLLLSF